MYSVCIEFGDRYYRKSCVGFVDCIRWIADVIYKESDDNPSKIWIDKEDVL